MRPATAHMTGAVDTAGPPTIATTNALPLTLLVALPSASFLPPIVTWALSVPLPWLEVMTPMKHALLLGTMTEI